MSCALHGNEQADENQYGRTHIWHLSRDFTKAFESLCRMTHRQGRDRSHADERDRQSQAERHHQREAEGELFQLQTDEEHRKRRGAWHQSSRQTEENQLAGRHRPVGEALLDFLGVFALVLVLVIQRGGM